MGGGGGCLGIDDGDRGASPSLASAPPVGSALACRHPRLPLRCLDPTAFAHRHSLMEAGNSYFFQNEKGSTSAEENNDNMRCGGATVETMELSTDLALRGRLII
uniref:Uncharacterized protein n=2 Tax=Oryza sativa subsp. japonica TaxID=39947 RepID=Q53LR1_ORYSJ|nr:hypothetical protein LOC_Os11g09210 [Oryza sativa Japonica Group]ABA91932.1 hypothetical protein LOC_Os11g09210 [Oryza sativa Japonica Group]